MRGKALEIIKALLLRQFVQFISGAAPARVASPQHSARQQLVDVTQGRGQPAKVRHTQ